MPYDYDVLEEDYADPSDAISPLSTIDEEEDDYGALSGGSPLSKLMVNRARQLSPRRQDIVSRRDALLNAYKSLINAQTYKGLPEGFASSYGASEALADEKWDGGARMLGKMNLGEANVQLKQRQLQEEALKNQAITQLKMESDNLGFLDKDQAAEMDLLKGAAATDYQQQMLQMKLLLAAMKNSNNNINGGGTATPEEAAAEGLPTYTGNDPYAGLDNVGKRQMRMMFEKQVQKLQEEAEANAPAIERMKRFQQLNELTKDDVLGPGPVTDYLPNWSDEMKEMESIAAEITPQMRVPGSGSTSDFDARMFQKATIGTGKRYEANKNIATAYMASRQDQIDKSQFMEAYLNKYHHLRGAQQAWKKYLNQNPIFDPNSKQFELNQKRKTWQDFYGVAKSEEGAGSSEAPAAEPEAAPVNLIPPAPKGYDPEKWKRVYEKMTPEQKKLFGGKADAP